MTHDTFTEDGLRDADGFILRHGADVTPDAMPDPVRDPTPVELAAEIVAAYVAHNSLPVADLPDLLRSVHGALTGLGRPVEAVPAMPLVPAASIRKSIHEDYLVCLEDGKRFKSLKRHLAQLGMTPVEYRAKWGLPGNYPMVAPAYAKARSALAKEIGLGQKRRVG